MVVKDSSMVIKTYNLRDKPCSTDREKLQTRMETFMNTNASKS